VGAVPHGKHKGSLASGVHLRDRKGSCAVVDLGDNERQRRSPLVHGVLVDASDHDWLFAQVGNGKCARQGRGTADGWATVCAGARKVLQVPARTPSS
jgi:hypothetical protein